MKMFKYYFPLTFLAFSGFVFSIPTDALYKEEAELKNWISDLVNKTINGILENITDPIQIDSLHLDEQNDYIDGILDISKFTLAGIKQLAATKIDVGIFSLAMNCTIEIPNLILNTKYDADLTMVHLIPFFGIGNIGVEFDNLVLEVKGIANLNPMSISNITVGLDVKEAIFNFHGLLENESFSSLVNAMLNENFVPFIKENHDLITNVISPIIQMIMDSFMDGGNSTVAVQMEEMIEAFQLPYNKL